MVTSVSKTTTIELLLLKIRPLSYGFDTTYLYVQL